MSPHPKNVFTLLVECGFCYSLCGKYKYTHTHTQSSELFQSISSIKDTSSICGFSGSQTFSESPSGSRLTCFHLSFWILSICLLVSHLPCCSSGFILVLATTDERADIVNNVNPNIHKISLTHIHSSAPEQI